MRWESHGFGPPNTLTFTLEDVKAKVEKDGSEFGGIAIGSNLGEGGMPNLRKALKIFTF